MEGYRGALASTASKARWAYWGTGESWAGAHRVEERARLGDGSVGLVWDMGGCVDVTVGDAAGSPPKGEAAGRAGGDLRELLREPRDLALGRRGGGWGRLLEGVLFRRRRGPVGRPLGV